MSRSTHDIECRSCHYQGKVPDDVIHCPKCGKSVEGQPVSPEILNVMLARIRMKNENNIPRHNKEGLN
ncbi:MAG TPA: hypothetical protein VKC54_00910 [Patescibacteria group bacterium]|nr:hypothetical protein [Patescibacteria group bacterium]